MVFNFPFMIAPRLKNTRNPYTFQIYSRMPYALERWGSKGAIVVNTQSGKHHSNSPIPMANAKAQLRLLRGVEHGMVPKKK
jgi:hypothetical protein